MKRQLFLMSLAIFLLTISLFGIVGANTLVGGKIYNSDYSGVIEGADIVITCGVDVLDTTSLSDGTYAVIFDSESCYNSNSVSIIASKDSLSGQGNSIINSSPEGEFVSVANVNIRLKSTTPTTRHSRNTYLCGNGRCDSGETSKTCSRDCPLTTGEENIIDLINLSEIENTTNSESSNSENENLLEISNSSEENKDTSSPITGAVTGTSKKGNGNGLIILLGGLLFLALATGVISLARKRKIHKKEMGFTETQSLRPIFPPEI
jgi:hypothetical protein